MEVQTIIHSNGSKWGGQEPDSIDKLIKVLKEHTIEERFFESFWVINTKEPKQYQLCPIDKSVNGNKVIFFGNFEALSHVFRIETNDPKVIKRLTKAIKNNAGWKKYYHKNLINN